VRHLTDDVTNLADYDFDFAGGPTDHTTELQRQAEETTADGDLHEHADDMRSASLPTKCGDSQL
jgi:hypothetical protein